MATRTAQRPPQAKARVSGGWAITSRSTPPNRSRRRASTSVSGSTVFAPGGFRSIGKQDLRSRMRWYGLYTQRKQGVPGERTGSAEPEEL